MWMRVFKLTLENVTNRNIEILAEGHQIRKIYNGQNQDQHSRRRNLKKKERQGFKFFILDAIEQNSIYRG